MGSRRMPRRGAARLPLALLGAGLVLGGCSTDKLLQVNDPAVATPGSLSSAASLPTLYVGALGDFDVAYSGDSDGNNEGYSLVSAVISDELRDADTFPTRIATDQRLQQPVQNGNTSDGAFVRLERARHSLAAAADAVKTGGVASLTISSGNSITSAAAIGNLKAMEGYTYVALAEGFCSGIPFSDVVNGATVYGAPLTQAQVYDSAAARFNAAIASDAGSNMARVGLGRALLDAGKFPEAAAAVASVPDNFVYFIEHSDNTGRQNNPFYAIALSNQRYTVADQEGGNGLPFRSALDPRVPWADAGVNGFDKVTRQFTDLRYSIYGTPLPLATGVEARLIEAEAALKAGDATTWLSKLNGLRAQFATLMPKLQPDWATQIAKTTITARTLPPLTDPGTADARLSLMFSERAFWLYTTGHRLGDLRRLIRQYGKTDTQVFPTGTYFKGGNFGHDVAFPIPFTENQNPNYHPDQCSTTAA